MSHDKHSSGKKHRPHILPVRVYLGVWVSLLVLTFVTVRVSYFDFGTWNLIVAMAVATVKASLVALFFMHLKYDERYNALVFVGSLAFLGIFFTLTLADTMERGAVDPTEAGEIVPVPGRPEFMQRYGIGVDTTAAADSAAVADSTAGSGDPGSGPDASAGGDPEASGEHGGGP